ncbi:MAG: hypothetical protein KGQ51_19755, partial [Planctomycetes bacterium]|nr:hypothetical protein [Planctomycetota bacterium]
MPLFGSIQRRLSALRQEFRRVFAREPAAPPSRELDLRFLEDRILYSASPLAAELLAGQSSGLE